MKKSQELYDKLFGTETVTLAQKVAFGEDFTNQKITCLDDIWGKKKDGEARTVDSEIEWFLPLGQNRERITGERYTIMHEKILGSHQHFKVFLDIFGATEFARIKDGSRACKLFWELYLFGGVDLQGTDACLDRNRPVALALLTMRRLGELHICEDIKKNLKFLIDYISNQYGRYKARGYLTMGSFDSESKAYTAAEDVLAAYTQRAQLQTERYLIIIQMACITQMRTQASV